MDDKFKKRMNTGVKIALTIDEIQKEGGKATLSMIISEAEKYDVDDEMVRDILFAMMKQGTISRVHDDSLCEDVYQISR